MNRAKLFLIIIISLLILSIVLNVWLFSLNDKSKKNIAENTDKVEIKEVEKIVEKCVSAQFKETNIENLGSDKTVALVPVKIDTLDIYAKVTSSGEAYIALGKEGAIKYNFKKNANEYYKVEGLVGEVIDICIANIANNSSPLIVFLMKDGTLEKLNITKLLEESTFVSNGKIPNMIDIIRIENVVVNEGTIEGYRSIIAIQKDNKTFLLKGNI